MCTIILLRRPGHDWPVLVAANRDERASRPWRPPARHWEDRPDVVAGFDEHAGGSWLGMNDDGVVAAVLNRRGTLGPAEGKRSRGELVLEALDHADAADSATALAHLDPAAYRPFNLVIADNRDAFWVANRGPDDPDRPGIAVESLPAGLSMLAADDLNDPATPRTAMLARFRTAAAPDPDIDAWADWEALMASREHQPAAGPLGALCVVTDSDYGTVSSSLIALPAVRRFGTRPAWRFARGRPGTVPYRPIDLGAGAGGAGGNDGGDADGAGRS